MVWSRLIAGGLLVIAVLAACFKSRDAVLTGHWAYSVWLGVVAVAGVAMIVWAWKGQSPPGGALRATVRWLVTLVSLVVAGVTWWLAPFPVQVADSTMLTSPPGVTVTDSADGILLSPIGDTPPTGAPEEVGVAFMPGALVDPRAYIPLLTPVAQAGFPVYIAKLPLGVAFLEPDVVQDARAADPGISQWVVAGHSLGGAVGADQAVRDGAGLILLASYPINDISTANIPVLSISGSYDGLTTPDDIEASRAKLPTSTDFVVVPGGIHAYFGDYGDQPGDGQATIGRAEAQQQVAAAVVRFLKEIAQ